MSKFEETFTYLSHLDFFYQLFVKSWFHFLLIALFSQCIIVLYIHSIIILYLLYVLQEYLVPPPLVITFFSEGYPQFTECGFCTASLFSYKLYELGDPSSILLSSSVDPAVIRETHITALALSVRSLLNHHKTEAELIQKD